MARRAAVIVLAALAASVPCAPAQASPARERAAVILSRVPTAHAAASQRFKPLLLARVKRGMHGSFRLPASFLGLSIEYQGVLHYVGDPPITPTNALFATILNHITANGSGAPTLRIGGGSTDGSIWNPQGLPKPTGISFNITPDFVDGLRAFAQRTGSPLILGLNMAQNNPDIAAAWAQAAMAGLPPGQIEAFEVGNEPDLYGFHAYGYDAQGHARTARPPTYSYGQYLREFQRFAARLEQLQPRPPLAAPGACCSLRFFKPDFVRRERRHLAMVSYHLYPMGRCEIQRGQRGYPTLRRLLADKAMLSILATLDGAYAAGHYRLPVVYTETNSVSCSGAEGVSDVFASSLWGADWLFTLFAAGFSGADFHNGAFGGPYAPVVFNEDDSAGEVRPLYYGMLLFSRATANRAQLLPEVTKQAILRPHANVKLWATREPTGTVHAVVINKDSRASGPVSIGVDGATAQATLERLQAPSLRARTGVTLGGQSFALPTTDGQLQGALADEALTPDRRGIYTFAMPAGSAAMLTVPGG